MQVIQAPDERLRIKTKLIKKITPVLLQTTTEMVKLTKTFVDPEGVGLAATQIGENGRYFVAKVTNEDGATSHLQLPAPNQFIAVFNPKILWMSKRTKSYLEGCLSIPNYYGMVRRSINIKVSYQDETGQKINANLKGILAWIFQHEIDHLDGILFVDRVLEQKGIFYKVVGKDQAGVDIFEEVTL